VRLLTLILESDGYSALSAPGGAEALALLNDGAAPDLIILDLQMPGIDGRNFYSRARQSGYLGPVIICSGSGAETARRELGASAAFGKPVNPDSLLSCVAQLTPSSP
jgi:CheY-like chemotaxis protein